MGTVVFLVRGRKLRVSAIDYIIRDILLDFDEEVIDLGVWELFELGRVRDANYFCESYLFDKHLKYYMLPFLESSGGRR